MTNSRISAWFSFLNMHYNHLDDSDNDIIKKNYRQWCRTNRCDDYEYIKHLVHNLNSRLHKKSTVYSSGYFKSYETVPRQQ